MNISQAKKMIKLAIKARRPIMMWGPAGIGKSEAAFQVADELERFLRDIRLLTMDAVDLRGCPTVEDGKTVWSVPEFLPTDPESTDILLWDELPSAPPIVQAGAYQPILDRKLGEYEMPEGVDQIAAGNREEDKALVHNMPSPLRNRFVHIEIEADVEDYVRHSMEKGIFPGILAFNRFKTELLHCFDPKSREKAFPSPRSWHFLHEMLAMNTEPKDELDIAKACVGSVAGTEYHTFMKMFRELPDIRHIERDPDNAPIPTEQSALWAITSSLAYITKLENYEAIARYINRLDRRLVACYFHDVTSKNEELKTGPYTTWAIENQETLI